MGFPGGSEVKNLPARQEMQETCVCSPGRKVPGRREWQSTPLRILAEKSHGERSLAGYSPWGQKEPDAAERTQQDEKQLNVVKGKNMGVEGDGRQAGRQTLLAALKVSIPFFYNNRSPIL